MRNVLEVVNVVYPHIHLVLQDEVEELVDILLGLLPGSDVVEQRRAANLCVLRAQATVAKRQ